MKEKKKRKIKRGPRPRKLPAAFEICVGKNGSIASYAGTGPETHPLLPRLVEILFEQGEFKEGDIVDLVFDGPGINFSVVGTAQEAGDHKRSNSGDPQHTPAIAEFMLTAAAKSKRDVAAVGCINEIFAEECVRFGPARARRRYWLQTLKLLWPILLRAVKRAVKWAVVVDFIKRHTIG